MTNFKSLDAAAYLPYALGRAIFDVSYYAQNASSFDTRGLIMDLNDLGDRLFKAKDHDITLHQQITAGAKVVMETKTRDYFREFIVSLGDTSCADFLQAMYEFLQQAKFGRIKFDLFNSMVDLALAVGTDLKEDLAKIPTLKEEVSA